MGLAKYLCKPLEPSWVLPHEGESCIPLPMLRVAARRRPVTARPKSGNAILTRCVFPPRQAAQFLRSAMAR